MKNALIIGAGFLGGSLALRLKGQGVQVLCLDKGWDEARFDSLKGMGIEGRAVDVTDREALRYCAQRYVADVIYFCAATRGGDEARYRLLYGQGVSCMLECFSGVPIVFSSSTSVYVQQEGELVTEESETSPQSVKGQVLLEAEANILRVGGVVARLGNLYGMGRSVLLQRYWQGMGRMEGDGSRVVNHIYVEDAVGAYVILGEALMRGENRGQVYNVVDSLPIEQKKLYTALSVLLMKPLPVIVPMTQGGKREWSSKAVLNVKMRSLGWELIYPSFLEAVPDLCTSLGFEVEDEFGEDIWEEEGPTSKEEQALQSTFVQEMSTFLNDKVNQPASSESPRSLSNVSPRSSFES